MPVRKSDTTKRDIDHVVKGMISVQKIRLNNPRILSGVLVLLMAVAVLGCGPGEEPASEPASEEELTEITVASFPFPALASTFHSVLQEKQFGLDHGLDVQVNNYSEISSYYASIATGEVDTLLGGPPVLQQMANEGVPIQGISTFAGLGHVVVISRTDEVRSIEDLEGHSLAASTGSAPFQLLSIYANSIGMDLFEDVEIVEASPPEARGQLEAGRVDAALMFPPIETMTLLENPDFSIVFHGDEAWEDLTGEPGWDVIQFMRRDFIEENPDAVMQWIETLQDTQEFIENNPEEAASIVEERLDLPSDVFLTGFEEGRLPYDIRPVSNQEIHDALWVMFRLANTHGFAESLPPEDILYRPE